MPSSHDIVFAALTDVGIRRTHNQDACVAQPSADEVRFRSHGHVFIVADGMGGHAVGEKASAQAVRDIPLTYLKHVATDGAASAIRRAFREANAGIYRIGQTTPEFKGLGTTGTALFLRPEGAWIGHVGDSRVYRIRGEAVEQLTFDHSWVWELARRQGKDPDELDDVKKNVIIRSLGPEAEVQPDLEGPHPIVPGDIFLLCSDGLTNHVPPDELGVVASLFPPAEACALLVELANLRGGSDNVTCLIVRVPAGERTETRGPRSARIAPLLRWWGRKVSWPLTGLVGGGLLIALAVWLQSEKVAGAKLTFVAAALATLAGLVGLAFQMGGDVPEESEEDGEEVGPPRVYKVKTFAIDQAIAERFAALERVARQSAEASALPLDWAEHDRLRGLADAAARGGNWTKAVLARCVSLRFVAAPLNKFNHKDEAFKPNWTTPFRALGG